MTNTTNIGSLDDAILCARGRAVRALARAYNSRRAGQRLDTMIARAVASEAADWVESGAPGVGFLLRSDHDNPLDAAEKTIIWVARSIQMDAESLCRIERDAEGIISMNHEGASQYAP